MIKYVNGKKVKYEETLPTDFEKTKITPEMQIAELKQKLNDTDYQAIKFAEGWLTDQEYAPIKAQRQLWRDEINKLEKR